MSFGPNKATVVSKKQEMPHKIPEILIHATSSLASSA